MRNADIYFHKEGVKFRLPNKGNLGRWIKQVVKAEGKRLGTLSFVYCTDGYLKSINHKYLKTNMITDVIAFEYNEGSLISGDIFISVVRVRENSTSYGVTFHTELKRVMVHGLLHLLGYRDKSVADRTAMTEREDLYLSLHP